MASTSHEKIFICRKKLDEDYVYISTELDMLVPKSTENRSDVFRLMRDIIPKYQKAVDKTSAQKETCGRAAG